LVAKVAYLEGSPAEAVAVLDKALHLDPFLFAEVAPDLHRYRLAAGLPALEQTGSNTDRDLEQDSSYVISVGLQKYRSEGAEPALDYFHSALARSPSILLL